MNVSRFTLVSLGLSALLVVASSLILARYGLRIGIDFAGGQLLELHFNESTDLTKLSSVLTVGEQEQQLAHTTASETASNTFLLRTATSDQTAVDQIKAYLTSQLGPADQVRFERVGPTIGRDLTRKAILGVVLASLGIILYIAWAFRRVPQPARSWRFGITAIIALIHDLLITVAVFAVLGVTSGYEVDSLFITALLTVMGFSVHDTIVTYDRIRENLISRPDRPFDETVSASIQQTIVRSLNTSLTLILVLLAVLVLGGSTIRPFIAALTIGVTVGTYSSIFVASQLLVIWQQFAERRNLATVNQRS
ncbi:protein translocase subunit SecF [Candidatus Berkelbacteria bacterium]|nr:protein translocase subunit SecF [Candidatus Berkelbacteria bacterium]